MGLIDRDAEKNRLDRELKILAEALTELREKAGLSKRGLAKKLGVSPNFIWRIENRDIKRKPSVEQLNKLAEALSEYSAIYADEFRQKAGIVDPDSLAILAKSQGFATTLESIYERFVKILKDKGLTMQQINNVLEQATEQTILDVVNGREPLDIGYGDYSAELIAKHLDAGHQVLDVNARKTTLGMSQVADAPSAYLATNKEAFLPDTLPRKGRPPNMPLSIEAGDARIVLKRYITKEERSALEAIAKVIAELLAR